MKNKKNILLCPMDWGLGHATRMVPIIEKLKGKNVNIILGADNRPYEFLKQRFKDLDIVRFPGYLPKYPSKVPMALKMISEMPDMLKYTEKAHDYLEEFVVKQNIDIVISDNRYELWSKHVKTVFITHQLDIQVPRFGKVARSAIKKIINSYIKKHDELWIPDFENEPNLSGKLSHVNSFPVSNYHFIGPLSRFQYVTPKHISKNIDLVVLLSGPEPQRTILEVKLKDQAFHAGLNTVILQGRPEDNHIEKIGNVELISHLPDDEFAGYLQAADFVISRPGYSTLMDLAMFGSKAIFIPTPGQTEQEYLARTLKEKMLFYYQNQKDFDLIKALAESKKYKGIKLKNDFKILESRLNNLVND
jgi:uncharacterized protein (TIGR00661 family)